MNKKYLKSILSEISDAVFKCGNLDGKKKIIMDHISSKNIKDIDKKTILYNISNITSCYGIDKYICNSLLKFEGLSL